MIKKINYRKIAFIGLLMAVVLLIPYSFAHAQSTGIISTLSTAANIVTHPGQSIVSFFAWGISTMLFIIGYFFHLALFLGGIILNWVLELNSKIVDNPAVQIGWPITRDIANLAFVFLIIVIAFETILRTGSLQVKQALPKLIVAAILINFSLLIAAMILDFAGVFTNFFLNPFNSASGNGGVAQAISSATQMYKVLTPPTLDSTATLTQFSAATVQILSSLIFADIITAVGAITMFGLAAMFLMRYVIIGILLITLPAAIIGWVIGGSGWSKWSNEFFKQTFFGPIAAFYIYIALKSYTAIQGIVNTSNMQKALVDDPSHVVQSMGPNIGSMIMVVAILMYGIKKAEEGSGLSAKWTTGAAKGAINGILKGTAGAGLSMAARTFTGGKYSAEDLSKKLSGVGKNSKSSLIRGITRPFRQVGKTGSEFQENYGGLTGSIIAATTGGIATGMGFKPLEFRKEEEKKYKARTQTITDMSQRYATAMGWDKTKINDPANDAILRGAEADTTKYLDSQKDDEKETALDKTKKYITEQVDIESLAKQFKISNATVVKAIKDNMGNKSEAKKSLQLEHVDIPIAANQLGVSEQTVKKALAANAGNISEAKKSLAKEHGEMHEAGALNEALNKLTEDMLDASGKLKKLSPLHEAEENFRRATLTNNQTNIEATRKDLDIIKDKIDKIKNG